MNTAKARAILADLVRVNRAYATNGTYRNAIREQLAPDASALWGATTATERARGAAGSLPFDGLVETSLALSTIRTSATAERHVNLVVGEIREGAAFAGIETALTVGRKLAAELGLPLRIVMVSFTTAGNSSAAAQAFALSRLPGAEFRLYAREDIPGVVFGADDVWIATHWKTAHAIDVAVAGGLVDPSRVTYLIQDYEPGFSPWSTEYAVAASTYRRGYLPIVNSAPLQAYLKGHEGLDVPDEFTFAPHLDLDLLRRVSAKRTHGETVRVLFYARPSKHRNLYRLGLTALKIAAATLRAESPEIAVEFVSAGERHRDTTLAPGIDLASVGTLPWDDYFDLLASTNVVLSLQFSPHPSHPPFDAAISGAHVVTNEFEGTRAHLHDRIDAVAADAVALAEALVRAVRRAHTEGPGAYEETAAGALGGALDDAVHALATRIGATA